MQLKASGNLVPRVLSYPPHGAREAGRRGPWERGWESGIPLTIGIQSPSSIDKDWNPVTGIQIPGLFWIPLHGATTWEL